MFTRLFLAGRRARAGHGLGTRLTHGDGTGWTHITTVPGASLLDRKLNELTVKELKRWLTSRKAMTTEKKANLVARY